MKAEEFYIEWSGEDDGEYVSMEFDDFLDHLSRFAEAFAAQRIKEIDISPEIQEAYKRGLKHKEQENKELMARNSKLKKRYKSLKDKNANKGREIKELRGLLTECAYLLEINGFGIQIPYNIKQALKKE